MQSLAPAPVAGRGPDFPTATLEKPMSELNNGMTGKFVVVRCRDAGVHAGVLEAHNGRECVLTEARRLWYWKVNKGPTGDFLNGIVLAGVNKGSKLSAPVPRIHLTENCEIIECTADAEASIRTHEVFNG